MADMRDVFPFIYEECPGAPDPAIMRAVRSAAIELLRDSRAQTQWTDAVQLIVDTEDYEIELDDSYQLCGILEAKLDGQRVDPAPYSLTQVDGAQAVKIYPAPGIVQSLELRVSVAPSYDSLTLRDDIFATYVETIAAGARARLQAQPGKPWSNANFAMLNGQRFTVGKNVARVRANRDGAAEMMVRMRNI
jgi:hypothetical protein